MNEKSFSNLLHYYRPKLNRKLFFRTLKASKQNHLSNNDGLFIFSKCHESYNADAGRLQEWLSSQNNKDINRYFTTLEGRIFKMLGFWKIKM